MYAGGFEQFEITGVKNKSLYECQMTPLISKTIDQFEINKVEQTNSENDHKRSIFENLDVLDLKQSYSHAQNEKEKVPKPWIYTERKK